MNSNHMNPRNLPTKCIQCEISFLHHKHGTFCVNTILLPLDNTRVVRLRKGGKFPKAAISEDLIKTTLTVHAEKPVQFKVRAVVTVRNKIK